MNSDWTQAYECVMLLGFTVARISRDGVDKNVLSCILEDIFHAVSPTCSPEITDLGTATCEHMQAKCVGCTLELIIPPAMIVKLTFSKPCVTIALQFTFQLSPDKQAELPIEAMQFVLSSMRRHLTSV